MKNISITNICIIILYIIYFRKASKSTRNGSDLRMDHYIFWDFDSRDCEKANFIRRDLAAVGDADLEERWLARSLSLVFWLYLRPAS